MNIYTCGSCNTRSEFPIFIEELFNSPVIQLNINAGMSHDLLFYIKTLNFTENDIIFAETNTHDSYAANIDNVIKNWKNIINIFTAKSPNGKIVIINYIPPENEKYYKEKLNLSKILNGFCNNINIISIDFYTSVCAEYLAEDLLHFTNRHVALSKHLIPKIVDIKSKLFETVFEKIVYQDFSTNILNFETMSYRYNKYCCWYSGEFTVTSKINGQETVKEMKENSNFMTGQHRFDVDNTVYQSVVFSTNIKLVESYHYKYNPESLS